MTERRTARRRAASIALLPAVAAVFGGSIAYAGTHDPLTGSTATQAASGTTPDPGVVSEQGAAAALAAKVRAAQQRLAELEQALAQNEAPAAPAPAQPAPAPAAPPPVHVTTQASG